MTRLSGSKGIRLIISNDNKKLYEARFKRSGYKEQSERFATKAEAVAWKRKLDAAVDEGSPIEPKAGKKINTSSSLQLPASTPSADIALANTSLVSTAIDAYLRFMENSPHPIPSNRISDYARVKADIGDVPVQELRYEDVCNYVFLLRKTPLKRDAARKITDGTQKFYAEATVRKFYSALQKALKWYAKVYRIPLQEHLFSLEKEHTPKAWQGRRDRRLAAGEEQKLYDAGIERGDFTYTKADWSALIGFALASAMREQEIVYARWDDLFFDNQKLKVREWNSKTRRERVVLLSKMAREIVEFQRSHCPAGEPRIFYQFPNPAAICQAFTRLVERAKIVDLHFHDLRHEATSRLCESGKLRQMAIMEMTGHRTMTTFQGYVHLLEHETSVILD
jgi:integrase